MKLYVKIIIYCIFAKGERSVHDLDYYFYHFPVLETDRLILREKTPEDAESIKTFTADEELYRYWGRHMTKYEREPALGFKEKKRTNGRNDAISWGIELRLNNRVVGEINLFDIQNDRQAMVGYRISRSFQGMGFVTEGLRRVIRFCFEETNLQRLEAEVMVKNIASNRVMEKCGFICEGTKRQAKFVNTYADYNIYGLLKSDILGSSFRTEDILTATE